MADEWIIDFFSGVRVEIETSHPLGPKKHHEIVGCPPGAKVTIKSGEHTAIGHANAQGFVSLELPRGEKPDALTVIVQDGMLHWPGPGEPATLYDGVLHWPGPGEPAAE